MNETEIVVSEVRLGSLSVSSPNDVIKRASSIATDLANIVEKRKLYTPISGKKYVRVEGWETLGAMLGVIPREVEGKTLRYEDGTYEATVELIRVGDGAIIGRGSAICGMDEPTWSRRLEYARRSMAITRATGKAYRLAFSWIMTLAGYEGTPAEEMPETVEAQIKERENPDTTTTITHANVPITLTNDKESIYQAVVDAGLSENVHAAKETLTRYCKTGFATVEQALAWMKLYRGWRDMGGEPKQAAESANNGEVPK
jgi:hypothetical protein